MDTTNQISRDRSVTGALRPPPNPIEAEPGWALPLALLVAGLILASRLISLMANPAPWLDEAMLGLNFLTIRWSQVLQPLPLFDQAAPLGCVLLGKTIATLFWRDFILAMRIGAVVASLAAAVVFYRALREARPRSEAALVVGLLMLSPALVFYSIEMKHYIFDVLTTVAVIGAGMSALKADASWKSMAAFTVVSGLAMVFSFTAVFAVAGFGCALLAAMAGADRLTVPRLAAIALAGLALMAAETWIYLAYAKPSTALQLHAYADNYAVGRLTFPPLTDAQLDGWRRVVWWLRKAYQPVLSRPFHLMFVALCVVGWLRGARSPSRPTRFLALGAALMVAGMIAAATLDVFTPQADRHLLFLAPITALVLVWGLRTVVETAALVLPKALRPTATGVGLAAPVLACCFFGFLFSPSAEREPVRHMLDRIAREGGWPGQTWVYHFAQPAADILNYPRVPAYLGRVSHASSPRRWPHEAQTDAREGLANFRRAAAGRSQLYLLFNHATPVDVKRLVVTAEKIVGPCSLLERRRGNRGEAALYRCVRSGAGASLPS